MCVFYLSYEKHAISVRTAGLLPIDECRMDVSYKNDPNEWKQLCIEGKLIFFFVHFWFKRFAHLLSFHFQNHLIDRTRPGHVVMKRFSNASEKYFTNHGLYLEKQRI